MWKTQKKLGHNCRCLLPNLHPLIVPRLRSWNSFFNQEAFYGEIESVVFWSVVCLESISRWHPNVRAKRLAGFRGVLYLPNRCALSVGRWLVLISRYFLCGAHTLGRAMDPRPREKFSPFFCLVFVFFPHKINPRRFRGASQSTNPFVGNYHQSHPLTLGIRNIYVLNKPSATNPERLQQPLSPGLARKSLCTVSNPNVWGFSSRQVTYQATHPIASNSSSYLFLIKLFPWTH